MTTEPEQDSAPPRRRFDDVAFLYGGIVPAPGSAVRPQPPRPTLVSAPIIAPEAFQSPPEPIPPEDTDDDPPAIGSKTSFKPILMTPTPGRLSPVGGAGEAGSIPPRPVFKPLVLSTSPDAPVSPVVALEPAQGPSDVERPPVVVPDVAPAIRTRARPQEIPWPDAFEPRPNFRKREPRNWAWLMLIPAGFVVAVAFTFINPRTLRTWVDANVLHRSPIAATTSSPLLPKPFRDPASTGAAATPPAEPDTTAAEPQNPYPAIPTSPVPVPPGTEVSPPPPDPTQAPTPIHVNVQYRRNIPGADGEARRIAALLQSYGGSIEMHPNTNTVRAATINYYYPADKAAAESLATTLANEAATWLVRLGTTKNPPGTLDVWLP